MCLVFILVLVLAIRVESKPLITREYEEKLRREVSWEVETYENNIFKGWTVEEFKAVFSNDEIDNLIETSADDSRLLTHVKGVGLPERFDGREKWGKCIHPIRNQGKCNACWAFALTGVMSDRFCIRGKDVLLSPQELVSCDTKNRGCQIGSINYAMDYMIESGISTESCFPYLSENTTEPPQCPSRCPGVGDWAERYYCKEKTKNLIKSIPVMMKEVYERGPLITHQKYHQSFSYYKGGIYTCDNEPQISGHFMKVVGWGSEDKKSYWTIANSFGTNWGEKGYVRFMMNSCGINDYMGSCEPDLK